MASDEPRSYIAYRVSRLPAGPFGETYVIATGTIGENGTHWSEFFVVSKRYEPHLYHGVIQFTPGDVPDELLKVDHEYLLSEAKQQAQNYLDDLLYQLAEARGSQVLDRYAAELVEVKHMPLLSFWMRGELHDEIRAVAKETHNRPLKFVLGLVTQSSVLRRG